MPATPWTEITAPSDAWQEGFGSAGGGSVGTVDFLFDDFPLTQQEVVADQATSWTELTAPVTSGTELTVPSTSWTEIVV